MAKDLYQVLGVAKGASDDEIRKAYRKLAKTLHPDLNPGDEATEERFKEVSAAFAIIGNAEKRAAYDRGEIDASGTEKPQWQSYRQYADTDATHHYHTNAGYQDFADFGDIFKDLFGRQGAPGAGMGGGMGAGPRRGADVRYHLKIGFLEAAKGEKKRITMPDGSDLDVTIPRGVADGDVIRLKGKGHAGTPAGDAHIEIEIERHAFFERDRLDVLIDLPITLDEAVLGGKIDVPTVDGPVAMTLPEGASSGRIMRLKGRGIRDRSGKNTGDQLIKLMIVMPDEVDEDLKAFMATWREAHAHDPRKPLKD